MSDLITLQEYKDFVGKTKADDDAQLNVIIPAVSNIIKAYLGNTAPDDPTTPIEEYVYLDYETDKIFTKYWPIRELISVEESNRYTWDSSIHVPLTANSDYYLINDAIVRVPGGTTSFSTWPMAPGVVKITYTAGEVDGLGAGVIDEAIKLAAIELTTYYLKKEYIQNRSMMGSSLQTYVDTQGMPSHIRRLLDEFKG